jgi:hypothetical protein
MMAFEKPFQAVLGIAREAEEKGIDLDVLLPILYRHFLVSPTAIKEELAKQRKAENSQLLVPESAGEA